MVLKSILVLLQVFSSQIHLEDVNTNLCFSTSDPLHEHYDHYYDLVFHFRFGTKKEPYDGIKCLKINDTEVYFSQAPLTIANLKWTIPKVNFNIHMNRRNHTKDAIKCENVLNTHLYYSLDTRSIKKWELDIYVAPVSDIKVVPTIKVPLVNETKVCYDFTSDSKHTIDMDPLYFSTL
jgi:hypothetical protein